MAITDQTGETSSPIIVAEIDEIHQPKSEIKAAPSPPEQMTLRQFKQLRGKYFTVKHKRMTPCGHRLDQINEPRNNCEFCWFAFFQTHGELVQTADRAYQEQGIEFLIRCEELNGERCF